MHEKIKYLFRFFELGALLIVNLPLAMVVSHGVINIFTVKIIILSLLWLLRNYISPLFLIFPSGDYFRNSARGDVQLVLTLGWCVINICFGFSRQQIGGGGSCSSIRMGRVHQYKHIFPLFVFLVFVALVFVFVVFTLAVMTMMIIILLLLLLFFLFFWLSFTMIMTSIETKRRYIHSMTTFFLFPIQWNILVLIFFVNTTILPTF